MSIQPASNVTSHQSNNTTPWWSEENDDKKHLDTAQMAFIEKQVEQILKNRPSVNVSHLLQQAVQLDPFDQFDPQQLLGCETPKTESK